MDNKTVNSARRHLSKVDPVFAKLLANGNYQVNFGQRPQPHFHALIKAIINQQLSVKAAKTIENRVLSKLTGRFFRAEELAKLPARQIRSCGVSEKKVFYMHSLSEAVLTGKINFRSLAKRDDDAVRDVLVSNPGIGRWSADMFLMFSLKRPDVFPLGDLVIRKSMQSLYQIDDKEKDQAYYHISDKWRPYRSVACRYLWAARDFKL